MNKTTGIYLHIPFCQQKCHYCNFLTFQNAEDKIERYVHYLMKEIQLAGDKNALVDTIYFGGGTPSYLTSDQMTSIMQSLRANFNIDPQCEITVEMNPESITAEKVKAYQATGINRFSVGVQSFNPQVLKTMGRLHNRQTALDKFALLKQLNCQNISLDLMFANPGQNMEVLQADLEHALALGTQHLSIYSLMIKEHTTFYRWYKKGRIVMVDDELERAMYHMIQDRMLEAGYNQYEISNFAQPGYECRHNQKYWHLDNYLGLGLGASGNIDLLRYTNASKFEDYFASLDRQELPRQELERLTMEDREKEYLMLNLRLLRGVDLQEMNDRFGIDCLIKYQQAIDKHLKLGVVQVEEGRLFFTRFGLDVGNQFYLDII